MGRTFSANWQPSSSKKKTAYKIGKTKNVRTAAKTKCGEAATALKSSISRGKLSDNDGKREMEVKLNGDYIPMRMIGRPLSLNSLLDLELHPRLLGEFLLPAVTERQTRRSKRKGPDGNRGSTVTMLGLLQGWRH
jgi:hypothetical protein